MKTTMENLTTKQKKLDKAAFSIFVKLLKYESIEEKLLEAVKLQNIHNYDVQQIMERITDLEAVLTEITKMKNKVSKLA